MAGPTTEYDRRIEARYRQYKREAARRDAIRRPIMNRMIGDALSPKIGVAIYSVRESSRGEYFLNGGQFVCQKETSFDGRVLLCVDRSGKIVGGLSPRELDDLYDKSQEAVN